MGGGWSLVGTRYGLNVFSKDSVPGAECLCDDTEEVEPL